MKETVMTFGLQGREVSEFVSNKILKNAGKSANRVMPFFLSFFFLLLLLSYSMSQQQLQFTVTNACVFSLNVP